MSKRNHPVWDHFNEDPNEPSNVVIQPNSSKDQIRFVYKELFGCHLTFGSDGANYSSNKYLPNILPNYSDSSESQVRSECKKCYTSFSEVFPKTQLK